MANTRLTPDLDLDGLAPNEAFAILGDETRLDVVRVLWEADAAREFDDGPDHAERLSYSALKRRVGIEDNGRFNYHLSKLTPHFVRGSEEGYRLSAAGKRIARTVVAVSGPESLDVTADLDQPCPLCGGSLSATYEEQWLRVRCGDCDGLFGDETPAGSLFLSHYPAAGMADRGPGGALRTALFRCQLDLGYMMGGICRECAGSITGEVTVCGDHESGGGSCDACGTPFAVWADRWCATCGFAKRLPAAGFVVGIPAVVGFLHEQGLDVGELSFEDAIAVLQSRAETFTTDDPFRVHVSLEGPSAALTVSLDDSLDVVGVDRRATTG